jgi:hypothetical protein
MTTPEPTPSSLPFGRWLRPRWFFAGFLLGLIAMALLGRQVTRRDYHPDFTRFFPAIAPEGSYYPTVEEMGAIVRARCRPDQILVIVGGNSVLQGVWQPADVLWTRRLQEQLGDHYCVVNFALRGAFATDGGAVIAEALRKEFPRQIYIANEVPGRIIDPLGREDYRTLFWHGYFGGYLLPSASRDAQVWHRFSHLDFLPVSLTARLDRWLRFDDVWNWLAFTHFNTLPSFYAATPPAMFRPRKEFVDSEPDGSGLTLEQRYLPAAREAEMKILRATSENTYERAPDGSWRWLPAAQQACEKSYREAFPESLHARTLMLIGRDSPFFRSQLAPDELARDEQAVRDTVEAFRRQGYAAIDYGTGFVPEDYGDRIHLAPSGGLKLATLVAAQVRIMAETLHYQ